MKYMSIISDKAKQTLEKIKQEKKKSELKALEEKKIFEQYKEYAIEKICPKCGKDNLIDPDEIHVGINGEYGELYYWFNCSCGFRYVGGDIEKGIEKIEKHIIWFKTVTGRMPIVKESFLHKILKIFKKETNEQDGKLSLIKDKAYEK